MVFSRGGFGSEARRWNLRRAANPIRDEAHILKAFHIEGRHAEDALAFEAVRAERAEVVVGRPPVGAVEQILVG